MAIDAFKGFSAGAAVLALVLDCAAWAGAAAPSLWISPSGTDARRMSSQLFSTGAPWPKAADRVTVFELPSAILASASDAELATIFAALKERNVALAIDYGMLTVQPDGCGADSPRYHGGTDAPIPLAARIARLGGDLRYVAMEEPLRAARIAGACRRSIDALARDAADGARAFASVFPNVEVGDVERVTGTSAEDVSSDWPRWIDAYQAAAGKPLAFIHADLADAAAPLERTSALAQLAHSRSIAFGIVYDAEAAAAESSDAGVADQIVLEAAPAALTGLADRYAGRRGQLR